MKTSEYTREFLAALRQIAVSVDEAIIERMVDLFCETRELHGRAFFLGVGGGAGHAGHAVNDFRKIAGIESYAPTDNVSELTARINDDGWGSSYANWLLGSRLNSADSVFVFSVGGGSIDQKISMNIVESLKVAKKAGSRIMGVVGRDGGYTAQAADACVIIPTISPEMVTALTESFQAVILHLVVSHPRLKRNEMKWEQTTGPLLEPSFSTVTA